MVKIPSLTCDLTYINANFNCLATVIKKLETNDMLLFDSLDLVKSVYVELEKSKGPSSQSAFKKLKLVLNKNSGFEKVLKISNIINA